MRPLEALGESSNVLDLLRGAPPGEVRAELGRLDGLELSGPPAAALHFAHGALALREGRLDAAARRLGEAAEGFAAAGEPEAAALARAEQWLARIRRGPRAAYAEAAEALAELAAELPSSALVQVVAAHYRGTALRYSGQAEATLRVLLDAFAQSEGLLVERAQVLNSLGTLYVVLGAYGAARAVLEHAAELNHQIGDRVSEAISYGQLGSAALAQGEQESARRYLQKQEWFASRVGDAFGQSRALTMLGDLALDMGRPDDALTLAGQARDRAAAVEPPLGMWIAYASRTMGRARLELGDPDAAAELEGAQERFRKIGNRLGEALVAWDLARLDARHRAAAAESATERDRWFSSAWAFATLGLTGRVAQLLADLRTLESQAQPRAAADMALAAAAQTYPHLAAAHEVELVYSDPDTLADIAERRIEGHRNLGRQSALTLAGPGLILAAGLCSVGIRGVS
jgi:tetratricopeptide (TPR) repeat protein